MKKVFLILIMTVLISGCGIDTYNQTTKGELLTIREYSSVTLDSNTEWYEISYRLPEGIVTTIVNGTQVAVGEKSIVIQNEGKSYPVVFLSVDDYNRLYGLE